VAPLDSDQDEAAARAPMAMVPHWQQEPAGAEDADQERVPTDEYDAESAAQAEGNELASVGSAQSDDQRGPDEVEVTDETEVDVVEVADGPAADAEDVELFPTPKVVRKPGRKPSVPSFDDILFGPGPGTPSN
jgi:hypothetical protein